MTDLNEVMKEYLRIKSRIIEISKEIGSMPSLPKDAEDWMNALPSIDPNGKNISIPQLNKRNKLRREYLRLKEEEKENMRQIKLLQIDEVLNKINKKQNEL